MERRRFIKTAAAGTLLASGGFIRLGAAESRQIGATPGRLDVRFLGTGAADWNGRDERGELRRLTSILVNRKYLIDLTQGDVDMLPQDVRPRTIFYTHSHNDHYSPTTAVRLGIQEAYMSRTWAEEAQKELREAAGKENGQAPRIHALEIGERVTLEDGLSITALPANHATQRAGEQTLIYLLESGPVRLLYATDTGGIPAIAARLAGIDAHVNPGRPITALIMEATMGLEHTDDFRLFTHSSVALVAQTVRILEATGRYRPREGQGVFLTHMARTLHGTQQELDRDLPSPLRAAYDGLEVSFT